MAELDSVVLLVPIIIFVVGMLCMLTCVGFTCCMMRRRRLEREKEMQRAERARLAAEGGGNNASGPTDANGANAVNSGGANSPNTVPIPTGIGPFILSNGRPLPTNAILGTNHGGTQQVVVTLGPQPRYQGIPEGTILNIDVVADLEQQSTPENPIVQLGLPQTYCAPLTVHPTTLPAGVTLVSSINANGTTTITVTRTRAAVLAAQAAAAAAQAAQAARELAFNERMARLGVASPLLAAFSPLSVGASSPTAAAHNPTATNPLAPPSSNNNGAPALPRRPHSAPQMRTKATALNTLQLHPFHPPPPTSSAVTRTNSRIGSEGGGGGGEKEKGQQKRLVVRTIRRRGNSQHTIPSSILGAGAASPALSSHAIVPVVGAAGAMANGSSTTSRDLLIGGGGGGGGLDGPQLRSPLELDGGPLAVLARGESLPALFSTNASRFNGRDTMDTYIGDHIHNGDDDDDDGLVQREEIQDDRRLHDEDGESVVPTAEAAPLPPPEFFPRRQRRASSAFNSDADEDNDGDMSNRLGVVPVSRDHSRFASFRRDSGAVLFSPDDLNNNSHGNNNNNTNGRIGGNSNNANHNTAHHQELASPKGFFQSMASRLGNSFTSLFSLSTDRPLYSLQTRGHNGYQPIGGANANGTTSGNSRGGGGGVSSQTNSSAAVANPGGTSNVATDFCGERTDQHLPFQSAEGSHAFIRQKLNLKDRLLGRNAAVANVHIVHQQQQPNNNGNNINTIGNNFLLRNSHNNNNNNSNHFNYSNSTELHPMTSTAVPSAASGGGGAFAVQMSPLLSNNNPLSGAGAVSGAAAASPMQSISALDGTGLQLRTGYRRREEGGGANSGGAFAEHSSSLSNHPSNTGNNTASNNANGHHNIRITTAVSSLRGGGGGASPMAMSSSQQLAFEANGGARVFPVGSINGSSPSPTNTNARVFNVSWGQNNSLGGVGVGAGATTLVLHGHQPLNRVPSNVVAANAGRGTATTTTTAAASLLMPVGGLAIPPSPIGITTTGSTSEAPAAFGRSALIGSPGVGGAGGGITNSANYNNALIWNTAMSSQEHSPINTNAQRGGGPPPSSSPPAAVFPSPIPPPFCTGQSGYAQEGEGDGLAAAVAGGLGVGGSAAVATSGVFSGAASSNVGSFMSGNMLAAGGGADFTAMRVRSPNSPSRGGGGGAVSGPLSDTEGSSAMLPALFQMVPPLGAVTSSTNTPLPAPIGGGPPAPSFSACVGGGNGDGQTRATTAPLATTTVGRGRAVSSTFGSDDIVTATTIYSPIVIPAPQLHASATVGGGGASSPTSATTARTTTLAAAGADTLADLLALSPGNQSGNTTNPTSTTNGHLHRGVGGPPRAFSPPTSSPTSSDDLMGVGVGASSTRRSNHISAAAIGETPPQLPRISDFTHSSPKYGGGGSSNDAGTPTSASSAAGMSITPTNRSNYHSHNATPSTLVHNNSLQNNANNANGVTMAGAAGHTVLVANSTPVVSSGGLAALAAGGGNRSGNNFAGAASVVTGSTAMNGNSTLLPHPLLNLHCGPSGGGAVAIPIPPPLTPIAGPGSGSVASGIGASSGAGHPFQPGTPPVGMVSSISQSLVAAVSSSPSPLS